MGHEIPAGPSHQGTPEQLPSFMGSWVEDFTSRQACLAVCEAELWASLRANAFNTSESFGVALTRPYRIEYGSIVAET